MLVSSLFRVGLGLIDALILGVALELSKRLRKSGEAKKQTGIKAGKEQKKTKWKSEEAEKQRSGKRSKKQKQPDILFHTPPKKNGSETKNK